MFYIRGGTGAGQIYGSGTIQKSWLRTAPATLYDLLYLRFRGIIGVPLLYLGGGQCGELCPSCGVRWWQQFPLLPTGGVARPPGGDRGVGGQRTDSGPARLPRPSRHDHALSNWPASPLTGGFFVPVSVGESNIFF